MSLRTEHLEVALRSLRAVYHSIQFESNSPALASWRSVGVLLNLADDKDLPPSDAAACLAVACDLLAFAKKSLADDEPSSVLGVTLSSAVDLLGVHQVADQPQIQQAEQAMAVNMALLELGVMEDQDAAFMTGALRGIVARSAPVILWATASLFAKKGAPLRKWLEARETLDILAKQKAQKPQIVIAPRSSGHDVVGNLARARERKVTLIEKKQRSGQGKAAGNKSSKRPNILRSRWKRRAG